MFINPEGSPFYIFRHYVTLFGNFFPIFSNKNVSGFLSLRYSIDFRRSRLVNQIPSHLRENKEISLKESSTVIKTLGSSLLTRKRLFRISSVEGIGGYLSCESTDKTDKAKCNGTFYRGIGTTDSKHQNKIKQE